MSSSDKYILITASQNLDKNIGDDEVVKEEGSGAAQRTLENQGIFIEEDIDISARDKSRDEFSRELMEQSGIEIVSGEIVSEEDGLISL